MSKKEKHITYDDEIFGLVTTLEKGIRPKNIRVRYSKSNIIDSIGFSDDETFMVQFRTKDIIKLLNKYRGEE